MISRVEDKKRAIDLRKQGFSYSEILKFIPVGKSTLSNWFRTLELTPEESSHLKMTAKQKNREARQRALTTIHKKRLVKEEQASMTAEKLFDLYRRNPDFLIGLSLYWAEGSHLSPSLEFTNSDQSMIKFMLGWFRKYLLVKDSELLLRLHVQYQYKESGLEKFWSTHLKLPLEKVKTTVFPPRPHEMPILPAYKGCMKIHVNRIEYVRIVLAWEALMKKLYSKVI